MPIILVTTRAVSPEACPKMHELCEALHTLFLRAEPEDYAGLAISSVCIALGFSPQTAEAQLAKVCGDTPIIDYLREMARKARKGN
jgi:hypothetical protein